MIIAEIGQNWCGDIELAKMMIDLAQDNGADLVKFQLYDHNILYPSEPKPPNVELSKEQAFELFNYGDIEVFFSVFDVERIGWCEEMGVKRYKIAFSQRYNREIDDAVEATGKPVIISDGRPGNEVTGYVLDTRGLKVLYCVSEYPAIIHYLPEFRHANWCDGFSDHTIGIDAAKIALSRGAEIIEKHFCVNHHTGIDAEWSMNPEELRELKRFESVCKEVL